MIQTTVLLCFYAAKKIDPIQVCQSFDFMAIREEDLPEQSSCDFHQHAFGQFNSVRRGVMELNVSEQRYLIPPHYALWIPEGVLHSSYQKESVLYNAIYVVSAHCTELPDKPAADINRHHRHHHSSFY